MWRTIPDFPGYEVSDSGQVRTYRKRGRGGMSATPRLLKLNRYGTYYHVRLTRFDGKIIQLSVHVLVLEIFVGPRPEGLLALHKDDEPTNNHRDNLYWGTPGDNGRDAWRNGRYADRNVTWAKLSEGDVSEIRRRLLTDESQASIAQAFGIAQTTVSNIKTGARRREVPSG